MEGAPSSLSPYSMLGIVDAIGRMSKPRGAHLSLGQIRVANGSETAIQKAPKTLSTVIF